MKKETVYAVCPACGKRAKIISTRWDWDAEQEFAKIRCVCGTAEVPFAVDRVVDINLNNPYMEVTRFKLLMPENMDSRTWSMIGGCLMSGWAEESKAK